MKPTTSSYSHSLLKRSLDVIISLLVLPLALVLVIFGIILLIVPLGPKVFYSQKRLGLHRQEFSIFKLRTLKVGTVNDLAGMSPLDDDFVLFGHWLRRWRIDELPQIINILKGEMSWIGPRPERPHLSEKAQKDYPNFLDRCNVKPGITGLAQINLPNATPNENGSKLKYDLEYLEKSSFWMDLAILVKTVRAIT